MHVAEGIGLAANQVGISKSFLTVDIAWFKPETKYPPLALINPVIEFSSDENSEYEEGCLSIPTLHEIVIRSKMIQVRYFDKEMKEKTLEADDLLARVLQHEIDHLNGILFYERVTPIRRTLAKNKLKKIQKGLIKPDYQMIMADGRYL
jgi:peptide deformylase